MPINLVQTGNQSNTAVTSIGVTLGATPTQGNHLIAAYRESQIPGTLTLPDAGWQWVTPNPYTGSTTRTGGFAVRLVTEAALSSTITFTSDTSDTKSLYIDEVSGLDQEDLFGAHNENPTAPTATSKQPNTTGTLTQEDCYVISLVSLSGSTGGSEAVDSGFTLTVPVATFLVARKITAATTALNPTFSWLTSRTSFAQIAVFKGMRGIPTIASQNTSFI